jgi:hypothetical protein
LDGQDQKRGLESVFDLVAIAEDGAADSKHHRSMPRQERGEGELDGLVVAAEPRSKPLQELAVAQGGRRPALEKRREVFRYRAGWSGVHEPRSSAQ